MARLKNSVLYNSINEKALTFEPKMSRNVSNLNLQVNPADVIQSKIDSQGLESEISAADKLAFLLKTITAVKQDLECKLADLTYDVVCHASGFDAVPFTVTNGDTVVIPYDTLVYTPADGTFTAGEFTAGRTGFYDVSAYFENRLIVAPGGTLLYLILGSEHDTAQADSIYINTDTTQVQGSRTVFCQSGQKIFAALLHDYAGDITFNSVAYPGAGGYISISYSARQTAATLV